MSRTTRASLLFLGILSAVLIVSQLMMGLGILRSGAESLRKAHQHSGYLTVLVSLGYIGYSLAVVAGSKPKA